MSVSQRPYATAAGGAFIAGTSVAAVQRVVQGRHEYNSEPGTGSTAMGFGAIRQRVYRKPQRFAAKVSLDRPDFSGITFSTLSGGLLGRLRLDVRRPIVNRIEFDNGRRGCGSFKIELAEMPAFPLRYNALVEIQYGNPGAPQYLGVLKEFPNKHVNGKKYVLEGVGLVDYLKSVNLESEFEAPLDVSEIVHAVADYARQRTPIKYISGRIQNSGILTAVDMDTSKANAFKLLETLSSMAGYDFGVDEYGALFFEDRLTRPRRMLFVGFNSGEFEPANNTDKVRNLIIVKRQGSKASGNAGWVYAANAEDIPSQRRHGTQTREETVPGAWPDAVCQALADALLSELKDPPPGGKIKRIPVFSSDDILKRGPVTIVEPGSAYWTDWNPCDTLDDWTTSGGGVSLSLDELIQDSGSASVRVAFEPASAGVALMSAQLSGRIKTLRVWINGSVSGGLFTVGCGVAVWDDFTSPVQIISANGFQYVDFDLSESGVQSLGVFGVRSENAAASVARIDRIEIELAGHRRYDLLIDNVKTIISPDSGAYMTAEFGAVPSNTSTFIAGLRASIDELKFTGEIR